MLVFAGDERIGGDKLPVFAGDVLQTEDGAGEGIEAPEASDGAGDGGGGGGGDLVGGFVCSGGFGFAFDLIGSRQGVEREWLALGRMGEDEAALEGVGGKRDFGLFAGVVEVEDEVVGEASGEDEGRAFNEKDDGGFEEAGDGFGVGRAQGRRDRCLNGGKADDDDGFWIVERGWRVQAEVEGFAVGEGDGGDVLILGGVEAAHEADEVDDRADVGAIEAGAAEGGVTGLVDEVGAGSVAEGFSDGLAVAVVQQGLVAGLGEAGGLGIDGLLEAVGVGLEVESAGEKVGVLGEGFGVVGRDTADVGEIGFNAGLFEAGFGEVLRGADEDAGAAADGGAEGAEVAAGFWCEKEDDLLGLVRNRDGDALFADFFIPGLDLGEPVVGGRVGGAAEEGGDEEVVDRLGGREVGVKPDLVAGLKVGNLGDGQSAAGSGDVHVNFGAGEVETRGIGVEGRAGYQEGSESSGEPGSAEDYCHHPILDGR